MRCRNCGVYGHGISDCPEPVRCDSCGQEGHTSHVCNKATTCFNCGEAGHTIKQCPKPLVCTKCQRTGHTANVCRTPVCYTCGATGHTVKECPRVVCKRCRQYGHVSQKCPQRPAAPPEPTIAPPIEILNDDPNFSIVPNSHMRVLTIPVHHGDYSHIVVDNVTKEAVVVDPSAELAKVLSRVAPEGISRLTVLLTSQRPKCLPVPEQFATLKDLTEAVYGPAALQSTISLITKGLSNGERFRVGELSVRAIAAPGDQMTYFVTHSREATGGILLSGDVLQISGIGVQLEEDMTAAHNWLYKVAELPLDTAIYCGLECAIKNLEFALAVDPSNSAVYSSLEWARSLLASGRPVTPTCLLNERLTNPFLRCASNEVQQAAGTNDHGCAMKCMRMAV
eukprot:TRINITY_DN7958_c0_g1_i4.p1 TRINITY_DN7958_c0_g1~~TRINITY_DN7958_c0_g1_i4.p1  ORF type:complete len:413 (+),score=64.39 TRINITY_DN7958_c0_g1_i4:55-1239(+)